MVTYYQIGTVMTMMGMLILFIKLSNKVKKQEDERRK